MSSNFAEHHIERKDVRSLESLSCSDDEKIVTDDSGPKGIPTIEGKVDLINTYNEEVPIEEKEFKVLVELTGGECGNDRLGVDLVAVLDVSESMKGDKMEKLRTAMKFVVNKLSKIDRLSIITFDSYSYKLCPLRQITEKSIKEIETLIDGLRDLGDTNITIGLLTGLKVLNKRTHTTGRVTGIMLMSDGRGDYDPAQVKINVPVHTFGFGEDHDPDVLQNIADSYEGGTFSDVHDTNNLSKSFSQCLGGLLTVVAKDLKLKIEPIKNESTINEVSAGNYPKKPTDIIPNHSVTVTFGDLYAKELRSVKVCLSLPKSIERGADVLKISYSYSWKDEEFDSPTATITISRVDMYEDLPEKPGVVTEEARISTARSINEARKKADQDKLDDAKRVIVDALNSLDDIDDNPKIAMMRMELDQFSELINPKDYKTLGRPFALSSETSHNRQRFALRGDGESLRMFSTPRMDKYLKQAKTFNEDPTKPPPSAVEDLKEEIAQKPLGPISGALLFHIQCAINSLRSIEKILKKGL